jgi:hypothetical protein
MRRPKRLQSKPAEILHLGISPEIPLQLSASIASVYAPFVLVFGNEEYHYLVTQEFLEIGEILEWKLENRDTERNEIRF